MPAKVWVSSELVGRCSMELDVKILSFVSTLMTELKYPSISQVIIMWKLYTVYTSWAVKRQLKHMTSLVYFKHWSKWGSWF